jgi:transcriptional regulator with XRE-family HTH domain
MTDTMPVQPPEARLLEIARERERLSVREAAERAGVSVSLWRQIEAGYATPVAGVQVPKTAPAATLARMALAVRLPADLVESEGHRVDAANFMREIGHLAAAIASSPPDRLAWAKYNFERWAARTAVSTCRDWDGLAVTEQAIWIDMVATMEERI